MQLAPLASLIVASALSSSAAVAQTSTVRLHAAGSLREAFTQIAEAFEREHGIRVALTFGASGLLRERIGNGEATDVFASANMEHPRALADAGRAGVVRLFARNELCALVSPSLELRPATLLDAMLDPKFRLGTSTPRADPSGDYAWQLFERPRRCRPARARGSRRRRAS